MQEEDPALDMMMTLQGGLPIRAAVRNEAVRCREGGGKPEQQQWLNVLPSDTILLLLCVMIAVWPGKAHGCGCKRQQHWVAGSHAKPATE